MDNKIQELEKTIETLKEEIHCLQEKVNSLLNDRAKAQKLYEKVKKVPLFSSILNDK